MTEINDHEKGAESLTALQRRILSNRNRILGSPLSGQATPISSNVVPILMMSASRPETLPQLRSSASDETRKKMAADPRRNRKANASLAAGSQLTRDGRERKISWDSTVFDDRVDFFLFSDDLRPDTKATIFFVNERKPSRLVAKEVILTEGDLEGQVETSFTFTREELGEELWRDGDAQAMIVFAGSQL